VAVIGPSGCGKSTFLRCLNLLEKPTQGQICIDKVEITDAKTDVMKIRQKLGMVFQHFHLFPHMTVLENLTYAPLKVKGIPKAQAVAKAEELLPSRSGRQSKYLSFAVVWGAKTAGSHCSFLGDGARGDAF